MRRPSCKIRLLLGCLGSLWLAAAVAADAPTARAPRLTTDGLAPVSLGMSIATAEHLLGARLSRLSRSSSGFAREPESSETCWLWRRRDRRTPGVTYMTEHGVIVRIDITAAGDPRTLPLTPRGVGLTSRQHDVEAAYGPDLHLERHPLEEGTSTTIVERNGASAVRLDIRDGVVIAMFAARGDALYYSEGCS
jgi:hypothetical protein